MSVTTKSCSHCVSASETDGYTLELSSSGRKLGDQLLCPQEWERQTFGHFLVSQAGVRLDEFVKWAKSLPGVGSTKIERFKDDIISNNGDSAMIEKSIQTTHDSTHIPKDQLEGAAQDLKAIARRFGMTSSVPLWISKPLNPGAMYQETGVNSSAK